MRYGVIKPREHPSRPTFLDSMTNQHQQILPINCRAKYLEIGILRLRDLTQLLKDLADLLDNVVDLRLALEDDCLRPDSTQTSGPMGTVPFVPCLQQEDLNCHWTAHPHFSKLIQQPRRVV
jgi:hypothetical protein